MKPYDLLAIADLCALVFVSVRLGRFSPKDRESSRSYVLRQWRVLLIVCLGLYGVSLIVSLVL